MANVSISTLGYLIKNWIDKTIYDNEIPSDWQGWCDEEKIEDAFTLEQEFGGIGLAQRVGEGQDIPMSTFVPGYTKQYKPYKLGLSMGITQEAIDDNKHKEITNLAKRLGRSMTYTKDLIAHQMLVNAWSSSYPGADGQPLCSASHPIPGGGSYSNTAAVPQNPSRVSLALTRVAVKKLPGHDGYIQGYDMEKLLCTLEQEHIWKGILESDKAPEPGSFNEINVAKSYKLKLVPLRLWSNTTTNWMVTTSAEGGFTCKQRKARSTNTWMTPNNQTMMYAQTERFDFGWTDARSVYGHQAA